MTLELDVMRGIQTPQLLHLPPGAVSHASAVEAIEWADSCGLRLDESQCITLEAGMGERLDHKWAAFEVCNVGPRQSTGKNDTAAAREGQEMFVAGSRLVIHTAHESKTADESFLRMEELISNNSECRAEVSRFRYGNGDHAVEFKSGARLLYKTRTGGAARGFAGASLLLYDEALFLLAKHVAASLSTLARGRTAAHNPQVWSMSSGALATSSHLHALRRRAFLGNGGRMVINKPGTGGRLAYIEHTAEVLTLIDDKIRSNRGLADLNDRRLWAIANPAMNHPDHGVSEEFIESEKEVQSDDPEGWARERLGFFDPPIDVDVEATPAKLPADKWLATGIRERVPVAPGEATIAFDTTRDGEWSSVTIGAGSLQAPYVETIEHRQGVGWLPARLIELVVAWKPTCVKPGVEERVVGIGCNGAGPAGGQVGPILAAFAAAGIDVYIDQMSTNDYKQACGGFYTDVIEGRLRRPLEGQGPLDLAAEDASERRLGDAWAWDRRRATLPISPLVSATIARALLPTTAPSGDLWFSVT